jgi:cytochrome c
MHHLSPGAARALLLLALATSPASAADAEHGKALYQSCAACHSERPDALGPSLKGVVGRKSAALEDFRYSNPMKRANRLGRSQFARLHQGPAGQGEGQPHARMAGSPMQDVDDIIAYLKTLN